MRKSNRVKKARVTHKAQTILLGAESARLRALGLSWREIGERLGKAYSLTRKAALAYLEEYCTARAEGVEEFRALQLRRLDILMTRAMSIAHGEDTETQHRLRAMDTIIKIEERRAKLLGLDAPQKTVLTDLNGNEYTQDDAREQLAAAIAKLAGAVDDGPESGAAQRIAN
jgi:hypothetical protein